LGYDPNTVDQALGGIGLLNAAQFQRNAAPLDVSGLYGRFSPLVPSIHHLRTELMFSTT
jgi:hypothetical protein